MSTTVTYCVWFISHGVVHYVCVCVCVCVMNRSALKKVQSEGSKRHWTAIHKELDRVNPILLRNQQSRRRGSVSVPYFQNIIYISWFIINNTFVIFWRCRLNCHPRIDCWFPLSFFLSTNQETHTHHINPAIWEKGISHGQRLQCSWYRETITGCAITLPESWTTYKYKHTTHTHTLSVSMCSIIRE